MYGAIFSVQVKFKVVNKTEDSRRERCMQISVLELNNLSAHLLYRRNGTLPFFLVITSDRDWWNRR